MSEMYFLRIRPLKDDLINGRMTERERFKYLLLWMLIALASALAVYHGAGPDTLVEALIEPIGTIVAAWYAFRRNGGGQGTDFLGRLLSLGMVIILRVVFVIFVLAALAGLAAHLTNLELYEDEAMAVAILVQLAAACYVIWAVGRHIGDVHRAADLGLFAPAAPVPPPAPAAPTPPGEQSAHQLERFVETVVQREMAAGGKGISAGSAVVRPARRRAAAPKRRAAPRPRTRRARR